MKMEGCVFSVLVYASFHLVVLVCTQDITYTIKEEIPVDTVIGNIGLDSSVVDRVGVDRLDSLRYSILTTGNLNAKLFSISSVQGNLTTAARIDRETLCPFKPFCSVKFEIAIHSETSFFSYEVKVIIEDMNDNKPVFPTKSINLDIPESSQIGVSFSFQGAVDNDTEQNSINSYLLSPENTPFGVDFIKNLDGTSAVSIVVRNKLDREETERYYVTVFAKDGGHPQRSGSMLVNISITDSNDNAPEFTSSVYNVTIQENTPLNMTFLTVKANDKDAKNNSEIFYRLSSHQPKEHLRYFLLDKISGDMKIQVAPPSGHIRVIVEASDRGKPPKVTQAFVDITVLDTENQKPSIAVTLFGATLKAHISEFKKIGYFFAHVRISDPDTGRNGNVTCNIETVEFALQRISTDEYTVIVARDLDREVKSQYTIVIFCEDDGQPRLNASKAIDVEIDDENDNAPEFLQSLYTINIPENNAVNDIVVQVAATDRDAGVNAEITYEIAEEGQHDFFIESGSSLIRARYSFDRENRSHYSFRVLAVDGGIHRLTATAQVNITILDLNDERPVFEEESYTFYVVENSPLGTITGEVSATDGDTGSWGMFSLILSPSYKLKPLPFTILQNGTIITTALFDAEVEPVYRFEVMATDHAITPLTGVANVKVIIVDQNEHAPHFVFPNNINNSIMVFAPHMSGRTVLWVQAYDDDVDDAEDLVYSLKDRNSSHIFDMNSSTGQIFLKRDISETDVGYYELEVTAWDRHDNPRHHTETLKVFIKFKMQDMVVRQEDHYVVIVIAIVGVTAVVAAAVLVTLCYLRKHDKDQELKRSFSSRSHESDNHVTVVYGADGSENTKTQLPDLTEKPATKDLYTDQNLNSRADHEMYRTDTLSDLSHQRDRVSGHQHSLHQIRLSQSVQHDTSGNTNINGRFWTDGLKQAEDFHSSSSGEVTTGDSGHGSDDDATFQEGASQSPRTLKLGLYTQQDKPNHRHSAHNIASKQPLKHTGQTSKPYTANSPAQTSKPYTTNRPTSGHSLPHSPLVHNNMQHGKAQFSYRPSLGSNSHSVAHSLDTSNHSLPSVGSRSVTFSPRPALDFQSHSKREVRLPYHSAVRTSAGSDDDTTTSGSYSVTFDDINPDLHDAGVRKATDAYV